MTKRNSAPGRGLDGFYETLRRPGITRISEGRWFAGVAAGLARRLGVDPLVVRAGFILLGLFFGMGIALYLVVWLLMPDERGKLPIESALKYGEGGSIFLLIVTGFSLFGGGPWWGNDLNGFRAVGLVAVGVVIWWYLTQTDSGKQLLQARGSTSTDTPNAQSGPDQSRSTGNAAAQAGATLAAPVGAPVSTSPPVPSPAAYPMVRTRTPTVGFAGGLLVLGLATVVGAVLLAIGPSTGRDTSPVGVAFAGALAALGLGLVVAGLVGRRAGWLTPFAVLGIGATLFTLAVPKGLTMPFRVGEATQVVTAMTGDNDYQMGLGQLRIDLTGAKYEETQAAPDVVRATVGVGELDLIVPKGVSVVVHASGRAGELIALGGNETSSTMMRGGSTTDTQFGRNGTNWSETVTYGSGTPSMEVYAEVGAGQIKITTGSAS